MFGEVHESSEGNLIGIWVEKVSGNLGIMKRIATYQRHEEKRDSILL